VATRRGSREDDGVRYGLEVDLAGIERLIERTACNSRTSSSTL
jgi:hypothetical protein